MPFLSARNLQNFRTEFQIPNKNALRWFPGHMAGGIKKMQAKMKKVDCVIEVHDARIPISGRNPNFKIDFLGLKPHILVLNKADLNDSKYNDAVMEYLKINEKVTNVVYTNCKKRSNEGLQDLIPMITEAISQTDRSNRVSNIENGVLIIGVPNVGKSSLINAIRSKYLNIRGTAPIGQKPGITKAVQTRIKVSNSPPVFIYDTPGILTPTIPDIEAGMKLALCGTILDHLVGICTIADYFLYWSNKNKVLNYMDFFGINEPCDNISLLLTKYAIKKEMYCRRRDMSGNTARIMLQPHIEQAAIHFVDAFRYGKLGGINLDKDLLR